MTIGRKLEIGVGAMLVAVVAVGIAWLGRTGSWDTAAQGATEKTARRLQTAADMDAAGSEMLAAMRGIVLFAAAAEPSQAALCGQEFDAAAGRWRKAISSLRPLLVQDGDRRMAGQMEERLAAWRSAVAEVQRAAARGDSDKALKIASAKGYLIYRANARDTAHFREIQEGVLEAQRADAASAVHAGWWPDLGALGLAAAAGLLALAFVRRTNRTAQETSQRAAASTEVATLAMDAGAATEAAAPVVQTAAVMEAATPAMETGGVTGPVDEIAFRTSLLSLNAALDAARPVSAAADEAVELVRRSAPPAKGSGPEAASAG